MLRNIFFSVWVVSTCLIAYPALHGININVYLDDGIHGFSNSKNCRLLLEDGSIFKVRPIDASTLAQWRDDYASNAIVLLTIEDASHEWFSWMHGSSWGFDYKIIRRNANLDAIDLVYANYEDIQPNHPLTNLIYDIDLRTRSISILDQEAIACHKLPTICWQVAPEDLCEIKAWKKGDRVLLTQQGKCIKETNRLEDYFIINFDSQDLSSKYFIRVEPYYL